jgi:hypothetical protein
MLSPKNSEAPNTPSPARTNFIRRARTPVRRINVIRAMMPPSPSLSARMNNSTYFTVTISTTDQTIIEVSP